MITDRVEIDPAVMMGKPVIRGTRIPVELILRKLSEGATEADVLDAYPRLAHADIQAALAYAADALAQRSEDGMSERDDSKLTSISRAHTLEEIADFWDTHSLADYWDQTHEAKFEVRAKRRRRITLEPELYAQVESQARARGIVPETLVNLWLAERLQSEPTSQLCPASGPDGTFPAPTPSS